MLTKEARSVRGATLESKGDRTRKRLLDAAAAEVARCGVAGISINAIAAAAGLKTGSVYFHFESKSHLIEAVLEEGVRAALANLDEALSTVADTDAAGRLTVAIRAHAKSVNELRNYAIAVLGPSFPDEYAATVARKLRQTYVSRWTALINEAQRIGALPPDEDPLLVRGLILGAINAVSLAGRPSDNIAYVLQALLGLPTQR
ncbi:MAG TPA: TetR family transcriptional regulator [Roseiarcus sp.]